MHIYVAHIRYVFCLSVVNTTSLSVIGVFDEQLSPYLFP